MIGCCWQPPGFGSLGPSSFAGSLRLVWRLALGIKFDSLDEKLCCPGCFLTFPPGRTDIPPELLAELLGSIHTPRSRSYSSSSFGVCSTPLGVTAGRLFPPCENSLTQRSGRQVSCRNGTRSVGRAGVWVQRKRCVIPWGRHPGCVLRGGSLAPGPGATDIGALPGTGTAVLFLPSPTQRVTNLDLVPGARDQIRSWDVEARPGSHSQTRTVPTLQILGEETRFVRKRARRLG